MSCHEFDAAIERLLADEIGDAERDDLLAHTQACAGCREFVDLHYRLGEPDWSADLPTDAEFTAMRRRVLARIREERSAPGVIAGLRGLFAALWRQPALAGAAAALLLVVLGAGWFAGRSTSGGLRSLRDGDDPVVTQIARAAATNRGLNDVENSPFYYTNVRLGETPEGRIAMNFDVTRHVEVVRAKNDPLVSDVLAQSLVNPTSLGTRLEALGHVGELSDPKIEQALVHAMLNDPNVAVRMRALGLLRSYPRNPDLEEAFIMVLSGEENVQLRLSALDWLAAGGDLSRERFDDVMRNLQVEDRALQVQAARYADRLN